MRTNSKYPPKNYFKPLFFGQLSEYIVELKKKNQKTFIPCPRVYII